MFVLSCVHNVSHFCFGFSFVVLELIDITYITLHRNILEKYTSGGMSLMGGGRAPAEMLTLDKKEVVGLLNLVRSYK